MCSPSVVSMHLRQDSMVCTHGRGGPSSCWPKCAWWKTSVCRCCCSIPYRPYLWHAPRHCSRGSWGWATVTTKSSLTRSSCSTSATLAWPWMCEPGHCPDGRHSLLSSWSFSPRVRLSQSRCPCSQPKWTMNHTSSIFSPLKTMMSSIVMEAGCLMMDA